jgi:predicted negative regulator of RcsB-dependent stress response
LSKTPKDDLEFKPLSKNLYVHKPRSNRTKLEANQETSMLSTLEESKTFYTSRQVERAKKARALARALGCPSDADLKLILRLNLIKHYPVV